VSARRGLLRPREALLRAADGNVVARERIAELVRKRGIAQRIRLMPNWFGDEEIQPRVPLDNPLRREWGRPSIPSAVRPADGSRLRPARGTGWPAAGPGNGLRRQELITGKMGLAHRRCSLSAPACHQVLAKPRRGSLSLRGSNSDADALFPGRVLRRTRSQFMKPVAHCLPLSKLTPAVRECREAR
jgi:hypothetical protein